MRINKLLKKGILTGLAVLFLSLSISLAGGEFIVKHIMPQETYGLARSVGLHIFDSSPIIPFTLQKNVKKFLNIGFTREFNHFVNTNSEGTRGDNFSSEKPNNTYRILFLGDSMTFGWGVDDDKTYPFLVEKYLNSIGKLNGNYTKIETINAGFADGLTLDSYYLYLKEIGRKYKPDLVVLDLFPYNDISDLKDSVWESVDDKGYPLKITNKADKVEDGYLVSRRKLNWKFEIPILRNLHLGILFLNALEKASPQTVIRIKNLVGVTEVKEDFTLNQRLSCIYASLKTSCPDTLWPFFDKTKFLLTGINQIVKDNNTELLVTIMASPDQAVPLSENNDRLKLLELSEPQKYFKDYLKQENINYLDLLPTLSQKKAEILFYKQDGHINEKGHVQVAKEIVKYLSNTKTNIFPKIDVNLL
jgi:lysophospholipase L1-like esterase